MNQVIEFVTKYVTLDNITFVLALIGSLGTVWNIFQSRKHIDVTINSVLYSKEQQKLAIHAQFLNKSHLPIAISNVCIVISENAFYCVKEPIVAFSNAHRRLGETLIKDFYTQPFPLQMIGLGGVAADLVFELPQGTNIDFSIPQTLQVATNRGRSMELKLLLHPNNLK